MNIKYDTTKLKQICINNDISYLGLFGSYADGQARKDSDVDLLVNFNTTKSLLEKGKAIVALQGLFARVIDLVSASHVKPSLQPYINKQVITLYGKKQPSLS